MQQRESQNIIEIIDLKAFGSRIVKNCYFFAFAFIIAGIISFYQIRYSVPQYSTYSKILLKDEYTAWTEESFIKGMELVSNRSRLSNEIGLLQSFSLNYRVIDALPYDVFYYKIGNVKTTELYKKSPFVVTIDTTIHHQRVPFLYLKFINKNEFLLSIIKDNIDEGKNYRIGQQINIDNVDFSITLTDVFTTSMLDDLFAFKVIDLYSLVKVKQISFYVETEPVESSNLNLSASDAPIEEEVDFLNTLMKM